MMLAVCGFINKNSKSALNNYQSIFNKSYNESSNVLTGDIYFLKDKLQMWKEEFHIDKFIFKDVETDSKKRIQTLNLISSLLCYRTPLKNFHTIHSWIIWIVERHV